MRPSLVSRQIGRRLLWREIGAIEPHGVVI